MVDRGTEAQKYVWEGAIALQIHLHESEVTTLPPPSPALILAPRIGYLPLLVPQIKPFFSSSLPPGVDTVWFEYKGLPLKWYLPTGVLFDLLCAEPERPWNLTAAYVINGNCKNIMNMSQSDQVELWNSVVNGNLESFIRVSSKLKFGIGGDEFSDKLSSLKSPQSAAETDHTGSVKTGGKRKPIALRFPI
ncbi:autophagy protein Apg5 family [Actinidia rufa]|uniref:Autophagy protein Apg5 family n=1 Tax=Actinidia rufa TaxID=165716 RepID=A0A7J0DIH9_9ERIC|nr:autophagy protein Apg5 family [Actinidia rufa]